MSQVGNSPTSVNVSPTSVYTGPTSIYYRPPVAPSQQQTVQNQAQQSQQEQLPELLQANADRQFVKIATPNGGVIYAEYGRVVSAQQFQADLDRANGATPTYRQVNPSSYTVYKRSPPQDSGPDVFSVRTLGDETNITTNTGIRNITVTQRGTIPAPSIIPNRRTVLEDEIQSRPTPSLLNDIENSIPDVIPAPIRSVSGTAERDVLGGLTYATGAAVTGLGYIGYLGSRPLALAEGRGLQSYNPSAGQQAGTIGLEAAAATGVGFLVGPIEAAILPESLTGISLTGARLGILATIGAIYGGTSSYVTGGNPATGAALGALIFPASSIALSGAGLVLGRVTPYLSGLVASYVPDVPENLNFIQRAIAARFIVPDDFEPPEVRSTDSTFNANQQAYLNGLLESKPEESGGSDFQEITGTDTTESSSGGQATILKTAEQEQTQQSDFDIARQQSAQAAATRIAASRGQSTYEYITYLTTPPGYVFSSDLTQLSDFGVGIIPGLAQQSALSQQQEAAQSFSLVQSQSLQQEQGSVLDVLSIQSQLQSQLQDTAQVESQIQSTEQLTDLVSIQDLLSAQLTVTEQQSAAIPYPSLFPQTKRKRGRRNKPLFVDYSIRNQLSGNIAASFGDVGNILASDLFSSGLLSLGNAAPKRRRGKR